jgi:hypothetical protein
MRVGFWEAVGVAVIVTLVLYGLSKLFRRRGR